MKANNYNDVNIDLVKKIKDEKNNYQLGLLLEELYNNNQGMIHTLIKDKFKVKRDDVEDAKQIIMYAMYQCALKFDLESKNNFSTYLQTSINNELSAHLNESGLLSSYIKKQIKLIDDFKKEYQEKFKKEPTVKIIAGTLGMKESKVEEYELYGRLTVSTNDDSYYSEYLDKTSIEDEITKDEQMTELKKAVEVLDDEEKELLFLYFGIDGRDEHSYSELAKIYKKSDETIRQRIMKILLKIKKNNGV